MGQPPASPRPAGRVAVARSKIALTRPFRRTRADRLVGILGALIVVGASVLLFSWEKAPAPKTGFSVEWQESDTILDPIQQELVEGSGVGPAAIPDASWLNHTFQVEGANVTRVLLVVSFQDDIGSAPGHGDNLTATVTGPDGTNLTATESGIATEERGKNLTFLFFLNPIPNVRDAPVLTVEEARAYVANQTRRFGQGEWKVSLHLDARGWRYSGTDPGVECTGPLEAANACEVDRANAVTVTMRYATYEPRFVPKT